MALTSLETQLLSSLPGIAGKFAKLFGLGIVIKMYSGQIMNLLKSNPQYYSIIQKYAPDIAKGLSDKFLGTNLQEQDASSLAFERNKELQDRDFAFQQQMWQQTNEYNSPENQMNRLRQAGLNPSLAYGQPISEATPMSGAVASAPMASGSSAAGSIFDIISIPKRLELLDAEIEKTHAAARKDNTESDDIEGTREARIKQLLSVAKRNLSEIDDIASKIEQRLHQNALSDAEKENISFEQMIKRGYLRLDRKRVLNETNLTNKQIEALNADIQKRLAEKNLTQRQYDEMVWTFAIRKLGLEKQVALTDAQITQAYATAYELFCQGEKTESEKRRVDQLVSLDSLEESWATNGANGIHLNAVEHFLLSSRFVVRNTAGMIFNK